MSIRDLLIPEDQEAYLNIHVKRCYIDNDLVVNGSIICSSIPFNNNNLIIASPPTLIMTNDDVYNLYSYLIAVNSSININIKIKIDDANNTDSIYSELNYLVKNNNSTVVPELINESRKGNLSLDTCEIIITSSGNLLLVNCRGIDGKTLNVSSAYQILF